MTILALLEHAQQRLSAAHIDEPQANSEWLLAHVLNVTRTWVLANGNFEISAKDQEQFERLLARKESGEPLSHIIGLQPFCGLDIIVTPDVLTPRPETEDLVEKAAAHFDKKGRYTFLDMCTGSGCIAVALAVKFPNARVLAVDISPKALQVAQNNI